MTKPICTYTTYTDKREEQVAKLLNLRTRASAYKKIALLADQEGLRDVAREHTEHARACELTMCALIDEIFGDDNEGSLIIVHRYDGSIEIQE